MGDVLQFTPAKEAEAVQRKFNSIFPALHISSKHKIINLLNNPSDDILIKITDVIESDLVKYPRGTA